MKKQVEKVGDCGINLTWSCSQRSVTCVWKQWAIKNWKRVQKTQENPMIWTPKSVHLQDSERRKINSMEKLRCLLSALLLLVIGLLCISDFSNFSQARKLLSAGKRPCCSESRPDSEARKASRGEFQEDSTLQLKSDTQQVSSGWWS